MFGHSSNSDSPSQHLHSWLTLLSPSISVSPGFLADYWIASVGAVSEEGDIVWGSGTGTRVAATTAKNLVSGLLGVIKGVRLVDIMGP